TVSTVAGPRAAARPLIHLAVQIPGSPRSVVVDPENLAVLRVHVVVVALDGAHPPTAAHAIRALHRSDRASTAQPALGLVARTRWQRDRTCEHATAQRRRIRGTDRRRALREAHVGHRLPPVAGLGQVGRAKMRTRDRLGTEARTQP